MGAQWRRKVWRWEHRRGRDQSRCRTAQTRTSSQRMFPPKIPMNVWIIYLEGGGRSQYLVTYLHIWTSACGAQIVNSGDFRSKTNAPSAMNAPRHDGFNEGSNVLIFHGTRKKWYIKKNLTTEQSNIKISTNERKILTERDFYFFPEKKPRSIEYSPCSR